MGITDKDLEDKDTLAEYLRRNESKLKNKIGIIKIDTCIFDDHHWYTDDINKPLNHLKSQIIFKDLMVLLIRLRSSIQINMMTIMNY